MITTLSDLYKSLTTKKQFFVCCDRAYATHRYYIQVSETENHNISKELYSVLRTKDLRWTYKGLANFILVNERYKKLSKI